MNGVICEIIKMISLKSAERIATKNWAALWQTRKGSLISVQLLRNEQGTISEEKKDYSVFALQSNPRRRNQQCSNDCLSSFSFFRFVFFSSQCWNCFFFHPTENLFHHEAFPKDLCGCHLKLRRLEFLLPQNLDMNQQLQCDAFLTKHFFTKHHLTSSSASFQSLRSIYIFKQVAVTRNLLLKTK